MEITRIKQCKVFSRIHENLCGWYGLAAIVVRELTSGQESRKKASEVEETAHPQQGFAF